jgi:hypothetical protein
MTIFSPDFMVDPIPTVPTFVLSYSQHLTSGAYRFRLYHRDTMECLIQWYAYRYEDTKAIQDELIELGLPELAQPL